MEHVLTHLVLSWLLRDAARKIPEESVRAGEYVLSYGWPMKGLGICGAVMMTGLLCSPLGRVDNHANQIMAEAKCRKARKLRAVFS